MLYVCVCGCECVPLSVYMYVPPCTPSGLHPTAEALVRLRPPPPPPPLHWPPHPHRSLSPAGRAASRARPGFCNASHRRPGRAWAGWVRPWEPVDRACVNSALGRARPHLGTASAPACSSATPLGPQTSVSPSPPLPRTTRPPSVPARPPPLTDPCPPGPPCPWGRSGHPCAGPGGGAGEVSPSTQ